MNKFDKIQKIIFIVVFLLMLAVPFVLTDFKGGGVSESEKRYLAQFPGLKDEFGGLNTEFITQFETWFNDNIGFRETMLIANAKMEYYGFNKLASSTDMMLGPNGELNYATAEIIEDYQQLNVPDETFLDYMAGGFQKMNDMISEMGKEFYYFPVWDKQTIYPEYFPDTVIQYGSVSRERALVDALIEKTDIKVVDPYDVLVKGKEKYDTFSVWGDPTHWSQRGAFISYTLLMDTISKDNNDKYKVLKEDDFEITERDLGENLFGGIHKKDIIEYFELKEPKAYETPEKLTLYADEPNNRYFTNKSVENEDKVLIMGDSYIHMFLASYIAESFHDTVFIMGHHFDDFWNIILEYDPDVIIFENAERIRWLEVYADVFNY